MVLLHLSKQADVHVYVSPPSIGPKRGGDDGPLIPRRATRGLGTTRSVLIPRDMWWNFAPMNYAWVAVPTSVLAIVA